MCFLEFCESVLFLLNILKSWLHCNNDSSPPGDYVSPGVLRIRSPSVTGSRLLSQSFLGSVNPPMYERIQPGGVFAEPPILLWVLETTDASEWFYWCVSSRPPWDYVSRGVLRPSTTRNRLHSQGLSMSQYNRQRLSQNSSRPNK